MPVATTSPRSRTGFSKFERKRITCHQARIIPSGPQPRPPQLKPFGFQPTSHEISGSQAGHDWPSPRFQRPQYVLYRGMLAYFQSIRYAELEEWFGKVVVYYFPMSPQTSAKRSTTLSRKLALYVRITRAVLSTSTT